MRFFIVSSLMVFLLACGVAPKDYSEAVNLQPINARLKIEPLWIKETGSVPDYAHAQLKPGIEGDKIYIADILGNVRLMNAQNGKYLWETTLEENLTSGPGVGEKLIYIGTRSAQVIALNKNTGDEEWRAPLTTEMLAAPLVTENSIVIQTIDGKVVALNSETGSFKWTYSHDIPKLTLRGTATPIIHGNQIIVGFSDGKLVSLNAISGDVNWKATITVPRGRTDLERLADIDGLFQIANNSIYVASYQGRVASVSLSDGTIQWARKMSSNNGLAVTDNQIFVSDSDGKLWSLDSRTGATLWRQDKLAGRFISTPAVMGNSVVVADFDGYAHWLSVDDGQFIARQSLEDVWNETFKPVYEELLEEYEDLDNPRVVSIAPLAMNNTLYIRDNYGAFAAFRVESTAH